MHRLLKSIGFLLVALGLLSCNLAYSIILTPTPSEAAIPTDVILPTLTAQALPQLTGNWHIRMAQTGGIAGVSRSLEISPSGEMTITDERTKKQTISQLTSTQISKLTDLVAATNYQPITQPTGCADCFIFDLQITNDSDKFQAKIDQVNLPNSGLEPLVGFLGELLNSR